MNSKLVSNKAFFEEVKNILDKGQAVTFPNKGFSMLPTLKDKLTEVSLVKSKEYKKYDICLFEYKNKYILHRLIKVKNDFYYFRGDHLYTFEAVKHEDIVAKVDYYSTNSNIYYPNTFKHQIKLRGFLLFKKAKIILRTIIKGR